MLYEKTGGYLFSCYTCICPLSDEVLLPWKFRSTGFDVWAPRSPNMKKIKGSYDIVSLFGMYIYMGERIAGKQYMPSLIIAI